ncbi:MAG: hypothetical protein IPP40_13910 [bacterium]|nr:hypothetical protein [bacterium]
MSDTKVKRGWQPVEEVNWAAFEKAIAESKNKQQILAHLRNLFEQKGYANMIRAAECAYSRLVEVLPGNKSSIGVYTYVDGKEIYSNFRFEPAGGKQEKDAFDY